MSLLSTPTSLPLDLSFSDSPAEPTVRIKAKKNYDKSRGQPPTPPTGCVFHSGVTLNLSALRFWANRRPSSSNGGTRRRQPRVKSDPDVNNSLF